MHSKQIKKIVSENKKIILYLLTRTSAEGWSAPECMPLNWCCMILMLLDVEVEQEIGATFGEDPETAWPVWPSTGFLERWRFLFRCLSQYFWSATVSLEHRHFFPSVRRHLPGSGSVLPEKPRWKEPHPTALTKKRMKLTETS